MLIDPLPYRDPVAAFSAFAESPSAALLSHEGVSYIVGDPLHTIPENHHSGIVAVDPFAALEKALRNFAPSLTHTEAPVPFTGGAVGYLGYELGNVLERLPPPRVGVPAIPAMAVGIYDTVAAFDHQKQAAWILSHDASGARATALAERIRAAPAHLPEPDGLAIAPWRAELDRAEAERRIRTIIDYIYAGDIFQANFTQRYLAARPAALDDLTLYRRLAAISPAPFAALLRGGGVSVVSASPERFLRVDARGNAETQPIKGTRPRGVTPAEDAARARELSASAKDRAENLMIVDLMRNDLARVCEAGSVRVPRLQELHSFAHVHHLVSAVTGRLREGCGAVDLLRASFPGGSVTGAPKIRAMEIIREQEPAPRGAYCGCYGWIGFDGAMDMAMSIRTLTMTGRMIVAQAGGGIVADSHPATEYDEAMIKIAPLLRAVDGKGSCLPQGERRNTA